MIDNPYTKKWEATNLAAEFKVALMQGWLEFFADAGVKTSIPDMILLAIASRETNMRNMIGDLGHGYGLMQIDIRYWRPWVATGVWKNPKSSILKGAQILQGFYKLVDANIGQKYEGIDVPLISTEERDRIAIACYNAGHKAFLAFLEGHDPDSSTTHGDYGKDVLARANVFTVLYNEYGNNLTPAG